MTNQEEKNQTADQSPATTDEVKKLPGTLTDEERAAIDEKVAKLEEQLQVKVHPVVFIHPTTMERKIGYVQEPNYATKVAMMDKCMMIGPMAAGEDLREFCLIKDASDPMLYANVQAADEYKLGVADFCMGLVSLFKDQFKKK